MIPLDPLWLLLMLTFALGALLVPDVGEVKLLDRMLRDSGGENLTLKLFTSNTTPAEGDTAATYTAAAGGGYADKTLTNGSWSAAATNAGTTSSSYAQQTWTFTGALTGNASIYGYFVVGATSGVLHWAERAAQSFTPAANGDNYNVTPVMELA